MNEILKKERERENKVRPDVDKFQVTSLEVRSLVCCIVWRFLI